MKTTKFFCAILSSCLSLSLLLSSSRALATTLPNGFLETKIFPVNSLSSPTAMTFAPDGRIFVCEKAGTVRIVKNNAVLATPFLTLFPDTQRENGLIGVTLDPNFATNGYVYVRYTVAGANIHDRVSRVSSDPANPDVSLAGSEKIIFETDTVVTYIHHGGSPLFGPDGKLYINVGDDTQNQPPAFPVAQSLTSLLGKMLRINSDGTIPTDNPLLASTTGVYKSIWAYGLRNPFTFTFQPGTGTMFINDVGQATWEEIDKGQAGGNYGWPNAEGFASPPNPNYIDPVADYQHPVDQSLGSAIGGGAFYNPPVRQFPDSYTGLYFFTDYARAWIHVLDPVSKTITEFATNTVDPLNILLGSDGCLYYIRYREGTIAKISYTGTLAPQIGDQPQSQLVSAGYPATFSITASGGAPLSYQWLRNNSPINGAHSTNYTLPSAVFPDDNNAQFACQVTNPSGVTTSSAATLSVTTDQPPAPNIDTPVSSTAPFTTADSLYTAGDTINFSGSATDAKDGTLPASSFSWKIDFHHRDHIHPFIGWSSGFTSSSFVIPTDGETDADVWYRIILSVADSSGLSTTVYRDVYPNVSTFNLQSNPSGLQLVLDGQPITSPLSLTGVVGITRQIGVPPPQLFNGNTYDFQQWSDGGAASHTIVTPAAAGTFTALFQQITPTDNATFVGQTVPPGMLAGQHYGVSVTMKNTGTSTWTPDAFYRLGPASPRDNHIWGIQRARLSGPVAPGGNATFNFTVTAPSTAGSYTFQWQMVRDNVGWFGGLSGSSQTLPVTVGTDAAALISQSVPASVPPATRFSASVTLTNVGTSTWDSSSRYYLGPQNPQDNTTWGFTRVTLPTSVPPGSSITIPFSPMAPSTPGTYNFQWRLVHDGVAWFGDFSNNVPLVVAVPPLSAAFVSMSPPPSTMSPGQTAQVSVTYQNTGSSTWTSGTNFKLGSQNPPDNRNWGRNRILLPNSVAPGTNFTFTFNVTAPMTAGPCNFQWRVLQEGVSYFGDLTPNFLVNVSGTPVNGSTFVGQSPIPTSISRGQVVNVSITMQNTGSATWTAGANFNLGSQNPQDNLNWGPSRVTLPNSVAPGSSVTFNFKMTAPSTAGNYNFQWRMVQDGLAWFGDFSTNVGVSVQ